MAHDDTAENWKYRTLTLSIPAFIGIYLAVGALPSFLGYGKELYLFYSWLVFAKVPSHQQVTYEAYVREAPGNVAPGTPLESAGVLLQDEVRNVPEYRRRIKMLGLMLARADAQGALRERLALEALIVQRPLTYEVVEVTYDPIERFLKKEVVATSSMGIFTRI